MSQDLWNHRSAKMRCCTCMWYVAKEAQAEIGRCRRHAPSMGGYPVVYPADWCGDHRVDENKIGISPTHTGLETAQPLLDKR